MSNERDTGRFDAFANQYVDTNVRIDFAWGNIPMQPDDDREENLDETLDSHIIATSGYQGFPAFIQGGIYDDTTPNFVVPDVTGLTIIQATVALSAGDLSISEATSTVGATAGNNNKVKAQSIPAGTIVNVGESITLTKYNYVAVTTGPISSLISTDGGLTTNQVWMYLLGRTVKPAVGDFVTIAGNAASQFNSNNYEVLSVANDDAFNTGGTKVKITCVTGSITPTTQAVGGTWTKVG